MIYLFYGDEGILIKKEINKIITDNNIDVNSISNYDLSVDTINDIIDDALTVSLFDSKKLIIVDNSVIFSAKFDSTVLEEYIKNMGDTIIIFVCEKIDDRKKIVKLIKSVGVVKNFNDTNINSVIKSLFGEYKLDYGCSDLLVSIVSHDIGILESEIEKIKIYKGNDLRVTLNDIKCLASKNTEVDVFSLIDCIVSKDKDKAMELYNNMLSVGEEPIKIIIMLANQFRIMYQVKELYKLGNNQDKISSVIGIHPYRVKLAMEKGRNYGSSVLLDYLEKLADLDYNIKMGIMDKNLALELFILGI